MTSPAVPGGASWARAFPLAAALLVSVPACMDGQQRDAATDLGLAVGGGTPFRGPMPEPSGGPDVVAAFLTQTFFASGFQGKSFSGVLGDGATAAAIELEGDGGYWVVVAGAPMPDAPDSPSFDARLSFSGEVARGPHVIHVAAVDGDGQFGEPSTQEFTLTEAPLPEGPLVVSLFWDTQADLDLHVTLPDGVEVYRERMNSWKPPVGVMPDPEAYLTGGRLDFDSNAQCTIDGRRNENFYFATEPPSGRYLVRVDTFSLCGAKAARFTAQATYHGEPFARATGTALPSDTRFSHGAGAGITAFELNVP